MDKFMIRTFIIGIILVFLASCDNESTKSNYGKIEGKILDAVTFEIIENVEISTQPPTSAVRSNVSGFYDITNIIPGQYNITVSKIGYKTKSVVVTVQSGKTTKADFLLEKNNGNSGNDDDEEEMKSNLIAHYKFDNNLDNVTNPIINFSGYSYQYTDDKDNNTNSAIKFNGKYGSYVITDENQIFNQSSFTYSCWLKPEPGYGIDYRGYIDFISRWGNWGEGNQSFAFSLGNNGTIKGMVYSMNNSDKGHPSNYSYFETSKSILSNTWSHVAITYSQNTLKVYIDGVLELTTYSVYPQFSDMYGLTVGKRPDVNQQSYYNGAIDDLRVYKIALSEAQIQSIFNN